jgi:hypothetical protein
MNARKKSNHPSMSVMPMMPYVPRCTSEYVKPELTDEEIQYAMYCWKQDEERKS